MRVICIDDSGKPNDIKQTNWIKKGEYYTPVKVVKSITQNVYYFVLEEVQPDPPYGGYATTRFGIDENSLKDLVESGVLEEELVEQ